MDNIEHRVRAAGRKEKLHDIDPDARGPHSHTKGVTDRTLSRRLECCCWGLPGSFGLPARRRAYAIRYHAMAY